MASAILLSNDELFDINNGFDNWQKMTNAEILKRFRIPAAYKGNPREYLKEKELANHKKHLCNFE